MWGLRRLATSATGSLPFFTRGCAARELRKGTVASRSIIDLEATVTFLNSLAANAGVKKRKLPVGLVGNRLKPWTSASQQAVGQLKGWPYPVVGELRDTQAYVLMVALGKSVFDYHSEQIRGHQEDWAPLLKWLRKTL